MKALQCHSSHLSAKCRPTDLKQTFLVYDPYNKNVAAARSTSMLRNDARQSTTDTCDLCQGNRDNNNNNNNLRLTVVKTNRSILHQHNTPVYDIQQSATQGSNETTHRLSCRTATTMFSPEGIGCQKQTAPRFCHHPIRWTFTSQAFTRWRYLSTHR